MGKSYSELIKLNTYEDRLKYLMLHGKVGEDTFGFDRYLNQSFYTRGDWRSFRDEIIVRDNGCDLGISEKEILGKIVIIHHINPITEKDIIENNVTILLNPENAICTSDKTHKAIHYGYDPKTLIDSFTERTPNDTSPWRIIR